MKFALFLFLVLSFFLSGRAQGVLIGGSGQTADSSAVLELRDSLRGFLPPRLTTLQRNAIANPSAGLTIFNTDIQCLEFFRTGIGWYSPCPQAPQISLDSLFGSSGFSRNAAANVTYDGGSYVSQRGFCLSAIPIPDINDTVVLVSGGGIGSFTVALPNLPNGIWFFIRAYAINSVGVAYSSVDSFKIRTLVQFTNIGNHSWVCPAGVDSVELLVVAGGGGGGFQVGGGGGGGGLVYIPKFGVSSGQTYNLVVGAGGGGAPNEPTPAQFGANSSFANIVASGGGRGSNWNMSANNGGNGWPGGSGGGGSGNSNNFNGAGGASNQQVSFGAYQNVGKGHSGGNGWANQWAGGGGGGAGAMGSNATPSTGGQGGAGFPCSITGTLKFYAGGGGGCNDISSALVSGGMGGGGSGTGNGNPGAPKNGQVNTGGGGGGVRDTSGPGGTGGSGIIILAYQ
jgi:hypothetical protein